MTSQGKTGVKRWLLGSVAQKIARHSLIDTHGRTGFQHWALGSVAKRVLGATRLPLLIVRPTEVALQNTTGEKVTVSHGL